MPRRLKYSAQVSGYVAKSYKARIVRLCKVDPRELNESKIVERCVAACLGDIEKEYGLFPNPDQLKTPGR